MSVDRAAMEAAGDFGPAMRAIGADVVIDMICFTPESARHLVEALSGHVAAFPAHSARSGRTAIPTRGSHPRGGAETPVRRLRRPEGGDRGLPARPGPPRGLPGDDHPSRPYRRPRLGAAEPGRQLQSAGLRHPGARRAADAAQLRARDGPPRPRRRPRAPCSWPRSATGARRSARRSTRVSAAALTLRGYAEAMAALVRPRTPDLELPAVRGMGGDPGAGGRDQATWEHIARSPNCSIAKARRRLDWTPRYGSLEAVQESVAAMLANGTLAP